MPTLNIQKETFDLHTDFAISRGAKSAIGVVSVKISDGTYTGWGECRPYARYNQTIQSVIKDIESIRTAIENGLSRSALLNALPAGAARNAVDCALWDLEAKQSNKTVSQLLGRNAALKPVPTVQTLSLSSAPHMAKAAKEQRAYKTLKIKLGGDNQDIERLTAIHNARPDANLVVDANEGWDIKGLKNFIDQTQGLGVSMIEQPLPKEGDTALLNFDSGSIILCGDESIHTAQDIIEKSDIYGMVNIKLDKAGGLTHALEMLDTVSKLNAQGKNIQVMVGCMVCSSLAIEPHIVLAQNCDLADLDGAWWLKQDRANAASYENGFITTGGSWG